MALQISHLVVNGCSYTYCQGLYDPPTEGWPKLLADKLGVPVVNLGVPGSSNDGIHRRTYDYFYKNLKTNSKPLFVMAMTMNIRFEAFVTEFEKNEVVNDYRTLSAIDDFPLSKEYFYHMNEGGICASEGRKLRYWASLIHLFDSNKTPFVTSNYMPDNSRYVTDYIKKEHHAIYNFIKTHPNTLRNFNEITQNYPKALDNGHDGPEAQVVLADYIYNQLIKRYGEIIPVKSDYLALRDFPTQPIKSFMQSNQWYLYDKGLPRYYGID